MKHPTTFNFKLHPTKWPTATSIECKAFPISFKGDFPETDFRFFHILEDRNTDEANKWIAYVVDRIEGNTAYWNILGKAFTASGALSICAKFNS